MLATILINLNPKCQISSEIIAKVIVIVILITCKLYTYTVINFIILIVISNSVFFFLILLFISGVYCSSSFSRRVFFPLAAWKHLSVTI